MDRPLPNFETFDFAVFTLAAQSIRRGVSFRFDLPISQSAANAAARIGSIWQQRTPQFASPMDIEFTNIVADRAPASEERILCISGGIDSADCVEKLRNQSVADFLRKPMKRNSRKALTTRQRMAARERM
ncbi:MAG: hypothetical protein GKR99_02900 [Rhodobacteraceae bacterium]|nr:hypothetical protein [Paracoccaceae bacterium]